MRVCFGSCSLDTEAFELSRAGQRIKLRRKAFELLAHLVETRPRVLTRAQLQDRLWPRTFVGRTSLARLVHEVRRAIGDGDREAPLLRTVPGVGYAFIGEAAQDRAAAAAGRSRWSLYWEGREIALCEGENAIGRDLDSAVQISASGVSRRHARVVVEGDSARIEDVGSKNGTYLRGERIDGACRLSAGDEIGVGPALLVFQPASGALSTATDRLDTARVRNRERPDPHLSRSGTRRS